MSQTSNNNSCIAQILRKTSIDSNNWANNLELAGGATQSLAFLNAHALNNAPNNPEFADFLLKSDFLLRDGVGIKMAMQLFGLEAGPNLNGTDLITTLLRAHKNQSIAIFGATIPALTATKNRLFREEGIETVIMLEHGFHDFTTYINACETTKPDIVILCMGMPKQELLAAELVKQGLVKLVICGGGWADFYSGTKKRAPLWIRKLSMEWIYRLLSEPKRLGKRYTVDILYFFYVILKARYFSK